MRTARLKAALLLSAAARQGLATSPTGDRVDTAIERTFRQTGIETRN